VPNFSEGRRAEVVDELIQAIAGVPGVTLLDHERDADHNRSVLTFAGDPDAAVEAAVRVARRAAELIDLNHHTGEHPRMGAADVVPFVPLEGATMEDCVVLARRLAERVGRELEPVAETLMIQPLGPVVGAHAGPGVVGVGCYPADLLPLGIKSSASARTPA
jgi:glutamate formiminotransferase